MVARQPGLAEFIRSHHFGGAFATYGVGRFNGSRIRVQRRSVPGSVPQPVGRPVSDRGCFRGGIGRCLCDDAAIGRRTCWAYYLVPIGAFLGAILTVVLVYNLARVNGMVPLTTLILAGVALGAFASALTSYLMLRTDLQLHRAISFLLGGSPIAGWDPVVAALPYMLVGMGLLAISGHMLNVLQFGEEEAKQMGLNVDRAKIFVIVVASLTTAVAVAFSGVIGFIGLIVPHMIRIVWGPDYRHLIPLSILGGGSALLLADMLARILLAPSTLPVGIVTALAGAPFFLWILRRAKREVFW